MFSGKLIRKKNPMLIAQAISKLKSSKSFGLLVVGDGKLRNEFETRMNNTHGVRTVFAGFVNQSELGKYYTAGDAFILPSSYAETWGLVVNEAQIFGLPVVVSDTVGCREDLVIPGETGHIFPSEDASALADKMMQLLENPDQARHMGENGRQLIQRYRVADAVEGIVQALEYVTGKSS
jgi:glycosyltransferase involved in cell wall biosynthesis